MSKVFYYLTGVKDVKVDVKSLVNKTVYTVHLNVTNEVIQVEVESPDNEASRTIADRKLRALLWLN